MDKLPPLPHLIVDEPKRSKKAIFAIAVISLALLAVPIGVFITQQQTQLKPQATAQIIPETSFSLESQIDLKTELGEIPVKVLVRSDFEEANLAVSKLKFDPNILEVSKISTDSGKFNKWIESSFDNSKGSVSLIAGKPTPGIKTTAGTPLKLDLATIYFKPKVDGVASLEFDESSQLLRASDSENILKSKTSINLDVTKAPPTQATNSATLKNSTQAQIPTLDILTPTGGSIYPYFKPLEISWASQNIDRIAGITLYLNDKLFGSIAYNIANTGRYSWSPSQTILLPYIQGENTFKIEILGLSKDGTQISKMTNGPFELIGNDFTLELASSSASLNKNLVIKDASIMLTHFLEKPLKDETLDLNGDKSLNDLDLWLLRLSLLENNLIK